MKELESIEIPYLVRVVNGEETERFSRVSAFIQQYFGFDSALPQHCVIHVAGGAGVGKSRDLKHVLDVALEEGLNPALITHSIMHDLFLSKEKIESHKGILSAHFVDPDYARIPTQRPYLLNIFKQAITGHSLVVVDEAVLFSFDEEGSILAELLQERYKNDNPLVVIFATHFCDCSTDEMYKVSPYLKEVLDSPSVMRIVIATLNK